MMLSTNFQRFIFQTHMCTHAQAYTHTCTCKTGSHVNTASHRLHVNRYAHTHTS